MKTKLTSILILLPFLFFTACKKDSIKPYESGKLSVFLTDTAAPGISPNNYDEINIDVRKVEVRIAGSTGGDWLPMRTTSGVYNLLQFSGGINTLIADENLPTGEIVQLRLTLGDNNSVKKDGVLFPMILPDAEKSKLTIDINEMIYGSTKDLGLDFDAKQSVVNNGNGTYSLHPVFSLLKNPHP